MLYRISAALFLRAGTTVLAVTTGAETTLARFARLRFIDRQNAAHVLLAVQCVDGGLCFVIIRHFDKTKTFAAASFAVGYRTSAIDFAIL